VLKVCEEIKLAAFDGGTDGSFVFSVSTDGDYIISDIKDDDKGGKSGSAY